jgi:hypothetical protein
MSRSCLSCEYLPLFAGEPDIWKSLDETVKEQVLDALATLLLRHLERSSAAETTANTVQEEPTDGR